MAEKLVLAYVDSLRTDMLLRAVEAGRAPTFGKLLDRGVLIEDCVSSFPSVTPVASAEIATGAGADEHWISGMNWYHRAERRYVEYGSSFEASRAFGIFRSLYDLVYNMNLAHLNPGLETVFETLDDDGFRTASTPFLIYRGRHRHEVSLEGLMKRAVEASGLKLNHATWGPRELFYGDLYASRPFPCKPSSVPGRRDGYSACCASELAQAGLFDFLLLSLPDNDNYSHRHGPEASVDSIERADECFGRVVAAAGGLDGFLADHALILMADHAQTDVTDELDLISLMGQEWDVLGPSEDVPEKDQIALSPTGRAAHVYLLPDSPKRARHDRVRARLDGADGVDLLCWLEVDCEALVRDEPGVGDPTALTAVIEKDGEALRFRPGNGLRDLRGAGWELDGEKAVVEGEASEGTFASAAYPDVLARTWSALTAPHAGDVMVSAALGYECVDWGGASHLGGGSHGSLMAGDSEGPLLFVGCGPGSAGEKEQWSLKDVAPAVRRFFAGLTPPGSSPG